MDKHLIHEMASIEKNYWWFVQKRNFVESKVKSLGNKIDKNKNSNILDCGCGTGETLNMLKKYGNVFGLDFDDDCINYCRKKGFNKIYKTDLNKEFITNEKYDLVVATDVLEHIKNQEIAYSSLINNLKVGGHLIITVPAHMWLFSKWDKHLQHKRRYSYKSLMQLLNSNGNVKIESIGFYNFLSYLPAIISRKIIEKYKNTKYTSEFISLPRPINNVLIRLSQIDNFLCNHLPFYYGLSLYAVIKKV